MGDATSLPPWHLGQLFTQWQVETLVLLPLLALLAGYLLGVVRARQHGGWSWWRTASFTGGVAVAVFATDSGIGVYEGALFTVHMVQHLLLIMVAPTLLALGRPLTLLGAAGGPQRSERVTAVLRRPVPAVLTSPLAAVGLYATALVGTHLTGLMGTIMTHPRAGDAEHWLYLVAGWLFFLHVFGEEPVRWRLSMPGRLLMLAVSMAVDTFVGVVLLQSSQPVPMMAHPGWGGTALADTHAGGGLMWFGGDGLMALQALILFVIWSRQPERVRRGTDSMYERVRRAQFAAQTGYAGQPSDDNGDFDDDDARREAYNAWLARLDAGER